MNMRKLQRQKSPKIYKKEKQIEEHRHQINSSNWRRWNGGHYWQCVRTTRRRVIASHQRKTTVLPGSTESRGGGRRAWPPRAGKRETPHCDNRQWMQWTPTNPLMRSVSCKNEQMSVDLNPNISILQPIQKSKKNSVE